MSSKNVDRLSVLPEEIISRILSLMPTKCAVQTSILSKSWRYSWTFVTNIDFGDTHRFPSNEILSTFGDRVMEVCKQSQIQLFRLHFSTRWDLKSSVSNWIDKAVTLNVRELDINVVNLDLPLSMFVCKTLTKLRLDLSNYKVWEWPSSIYLPCLKTLDITVYTNPFVNEFKLIRGCPMLETLSLEVIRRKNHQRDYVFNIPTLKQLELTLPHGTYFMDNVVLRLPNLEYLFFCGMLPSFFVMEDFSSLVEASVDTRFDDNLLVDLLNGLSGVKSLSVQKFLSTSPLPVFPNMKHLELKSVWRSGPILQFLESCPKLKHLYIEELQVYALVEPKSVPACMLTNLTTIKISICNALNAEIKFLEYMLGNAEVLKTVTITWKYTSTIEEENRLCAKLLKFPRASTYCDIRFHGSLSRSTIS